MPATHLPEPRAGDTVPSRVAVVGAANMDILVQTSTGLAPSDSNPGRILCAPGGVGRNVAENLARLGLATHLYSVVGDDVFGHALLAATRRAGVDVSGVGVDAACGSACYLAWHGGDGDMLAAVNDMALLNQLTPAALQAWQTDLLQAQRLVLDCNLLPDTLAWLLQSCAMPVYVDAVSTVKCERVLPWLGRVQLLKVNQKEAAVMSGLRVESVEQARVAASALHHAGVKQVVISLGAQGVCWCDADGRTGYHPARAVSVVNTSGAGDALLAGLVLGGAQGVPLAQAVTLAMACAEITLASPHANAPQLSAAAVQAHLAGADRAAGPPRP